MLIHALCVVALVLQVIALSTNFWSVQKGSSTGIVTMSVNKTHWGLWDMCPKSPSKCKPLKPTGNMATSLKVCKALAILGAVFSVAGIASIVYNTSKACQLAWLVLAGICSILASVIWSAKLINVSGLQGVPGMSFILNSVGGVLLLVTAGYKHGKGL
jgi:hypothetical protein